jgi:cytochrome c2
MRVTLALLLFLWTGAAAAQEADAGRGRHLIEQCGCGACHEIPGISQATGNVGPPLRRMGTRAFVAGMLPNTRENMVRWLRDPQHIVPGNAMPNLGLDDRDARDIAAYLATLR